MTVDGRNRWAACQRAGVEPRTRPWAGEHGSPTRYAIAVNVQRRHLTASQKALVAVEALPLLEDEAAKRKAAKARENAAAQPRGADGKVGPKPVEPKIGPNRPPSPTSPPPKREREKAASDAASIVGVSRGYVEEAKAIASARPDLAERVRQGELTLPQARREVRRAEVVADLERVAAQEVADLEARVAELARPSPVDPLAVPADERLRARLRVLARRACEREDWQGVGRALWLAWRPARRRRR